ncbi:Ubiquitin-like protein 7 [Sparganum proliferum]
MLTLLVAPLRISSTTNLPVFDKIFSYLIYNRSENIFMHSISVNVLRIGPGWEMRKAVLTSPDLSVPISSLFSQFLDGTEAVNQTDIKIIHAGTLLDQSTPLSETLGDFCRDGCLTFVIKPTLGASSGGSTQAQPKIPRGFMKTVQRNQEKLYFWFRDRTWLNGLLRNCPGVQNDWLVSTLLQDHRLIICAFKDRKNIEKLLSTHPCLIEAIQYVDKCLRQSGSAVDTSQLNSLTERDFSLDRFGLFEESAESDGDGDDVEDGEGGGEAEMPDAAVSASDAAHLVNLLAARPYTGPATTSRPGPARIDPQALHAALQQATVAQQPTHAPRPLTTSIGTAVPDVSSVPTVDAATITAMETDPPAAPPVDPAIRWASQLAIFTEMGITDTATVIQTLEATNGDVNLALQLLFH